MFDVSVTEEKFEGKVLTSARNTSNAHQQTRSEVEGGV
jgi:hypothetical protein